MMVKRFAEGLVVDFVKTCVDVSKFLECCQGCPDYEKRWTCPPFGFSVESIWNKYYSILLYEEIIPIGQGIRDVEYSQNDLIRISRSLLAPYKLQMMEELLALEARHSGSMALFAGACDVCENCTKEKGDACRHPERMRYSIESLGCNVTQAVSIYFDDTILWARAGHLPEYYILLGALLKY